MARKYPPEAQPCPDANAESPHVGKLQAPDGYTHYLKLKIDKLLAGQCRLLGCVPF